MYTSQPFLSQPGHHPMENSGRDGGYVCAQQHEPPLTKAHLLRPLLSAWCASTGDQHWAPDMAPLPGDAQPAMGWQVGYMDCFPFGKGSILCLLEQTLWIWICLQTMFLPKLPSMDLQNTLATIMAFHIALLLIKEPIPQQIKYSNGLMLIKFSSLIMFPTILK